MSSVDVCQSGMATVFLRLRAIVEVLLCVAIIVWSFLELFCQLGMIAAVSSAKVLRWVVGILCSMILSRESVAMANMSGESGQPCRSPLVATNVVHEVLLIRMLSVLLW